MKTSELEELTDLSKDIYIPVITLDDTGRYNNYKINTSNLLTTSINSTVNKVNLTLDLQKDNLEQQLEQIRDQAKNEIQNLLDKVNKDLSDSINAANEFLKKYQSGESDIQTALDNVSKELTNSITRASDLLNDCETMYNDYFDSEEGQFRKILDSYNEKINQINQSISQVNDFNNGILLNKKYIDDQLAQIGWSNSSWNKDAQIYQELNSYINSELKIIQDNILTLKNSDTGESITDVISRVTENSIENKINTIDYTLVDTVETIESNVDYKSNLLAANRYYYEIIPQIKYKGDFETKNINNLVFNIKLNLRNFDSSSANKILFQLTNGSDTVTLFYDKDNNSIKYTSASDDNKTIILQHKVVTFYINENEFLVNDTDIKPNLSETFFTANNFEIYINNTVETQKYFVGGNGEDIDYFNGINYESLPEEGYFEFTDKQQLTFKSYYPYKIKLKLILSQLLSDLTVEQGKIYALIADQKKELNNTKEKIAKLETTADNITADVMSKITSDNDNTIKNKVSLLLINDENIKSTVQQTAESSQLIQNKFNELNQNIDGLSDKTASYSLIHVKELDKEKTVEINDILEYHLKDSFCEEINNSEYKANYIRFETNDVSHIEYYIINDKKIEIKETDGKYTPNKIKLLYNIEDDIVLKFKNETPYNFTYSIKAFRSNDINFNWFRTSEDGLKNDIAKQIINEEKFDLNDGLNKTLNKGINYTFTWTNVESLNYQIGILNNGKIDNLENKVLTKDENVIYPTSNKVIIIEPLDSNLIIKYKIGEATSTLIQDTNELSVSTSKIKDDQKLYNIQLNEFKTSLDEFKNKISDIQYYKLSPMYTEDTTNTYSILIANIDYIISGATSYKLGDANIVEISEPTTIKPTKTGINLILYGCSESTTVSYSVEQVLSAIKQDKEGITLEAIASSINEEGSLTNKAVLGITNKGITTAIENENGALYKFVQKADSSYKSLQKGGDINEQIELISTTVRTITDEKTGYSSQLKQTADQLNSKITDTNGQISEIRQTVGEIQAQVGENMGLDITDGCTYLANRTAGFKTTGNPDETKNIDSILDGFVNDSTKNGSGYLANGAIKWDGSGKLVIGGNVDFTTNTSLYGNDDLLHECNLGINANKHFNLSQPNISHSGKWYYDLLLANRKWQYESEAFELSDSDSDMNNAIQGLNSWKLPDPEKYLGRTITLTGTINCYAGGLILEAVVCGGPAESGGVKGFLFKDYMPRVTIEGNNLWIKWGCKAGAINSVDYLKYTSKFYKLGKFNWDLMTNTKITGIDGRENGFLCAFGIIPESDVTNTGEFANVIRDIDSFMPRYLGFDLDGDLSRINLIKGLKEALNNQDFALYLAPNILRRLESWDNITVKLSATAKKEYYTLLGDTNKPNRTYTIYYWEIQTTDFMPITGLFRYNTKQTNLLSNSGYTQTSLDEYYNNFEKPLLNYFGFTLKQVASYEDYLALQNLQLS